MWIDIHISDDISASRYEGVFGVVSVRLPTTRRQSVHSGGISKCCSTVTIGQQRAAEKNWCRVLDCSANEHATGHNDASGCLDATLTVSLSQVFGEAELRIIGFDCETCQCIEDVEGGEARRR